VAHLNDIMIFIIDDDEAVRDSLSLLVETHEMQAVAFASTEDFVRAYRPYPRQCLVLDQHLTGMKTGLDFLDSPNWATVRLPVILMTGRGDDEIRARARAAGVAAYLDKPIDADRLIDAIERAIGLAA
jgi:two-component system, LuxR family, response regulator FixJ